MGVQTSNGGVENTCALYGIISGIVVTLFPCVLMLPKLITAFIICPSHHPLWGEVLRISENSSENYHNEGVDLPKAALRRNYQNYPAVDTFVISDPL
jgi:hypothetical protein